MVSIKLSTIILVANIDEESCTTMKIPHTVVVRHHFFHNRAIHRMSRWHGNRGDKKIDSKLKKLADSYGAENLAQGLTNHLTNFALEALNQQLDQSPLPKFIQDELRSVTTEQCKKSLSADTGACQVERNLLFEDYAAVAESSISDEIGETLSGFISSVDTHASIMKPNLRISLSFMLNCLYEKLIFQAAQITVQSDIDDESSNWLVALSGAFASLQTEFLTAVVKNLGTMEECSRFTIHDQTALDLMTESDRNQYQLKYDQSRRRFVVAKSHFKANLRLFTNSTHLLANVFDLFKEPCQY
jgi:hypothetical protein